MARNLGRTDCAQCGYPKMRLEEPARLITKKEAGRFERAHTVTLVVANAVCPVCKTRYVAWVDRNVDRERWIKPGKKTQYYVDLSYRSTFDDEPGEKDIPYRVDVFQAKNMISRLKSDERQDPRDPRQVVLIQSVTMVFLTPYES